MIKKAITAVLLLFVASSIVFLVANESTERTGDSAAPAPASRGEANRAGTATASSVPSLSNAQSAETVVYYLHGTMRCPTCLKMEQYAREAVEEAFAAEMDGGLIAWRALNYDEPSNEHLAKEYGLTSSAIVVVSRARGGKATWRNLDRIWDLVGDEAAFRSYVVDAVTAMRQGES